MWKGEIIYSNINKVPREIFTWKCLVFPSYRQILLRKLRSLRAFLRANVICAKFHFYEIVFYFSPRPDIFLSYFAFFFNGEMREFSTYFRQIRFCDTTLHWDGNNYESSGNRVFSYFVKICIKLNI